MPVPANSDNVPLIPAEPMTAKMSVFCDQYVIDNNATQAAIRAGYSKRSAGPLGSRMLKDPRISARIGQLRADLLDRSKATADNVVERYRRMAMTDASSLLVQGDDGQYRFLAPHELSEGQRALIASVSVRTEEHESYDDDGNRSVTQQQFFRYTLVNGKDALDSLARTLGLFRDRVEHDHSHRVGGVFRFITENVDQSETVARLDAKYGRAGVLVEGQSRRLSGSAGDDDGKGPGG